MPAGDDRGTARFAGWQGGRATGGVPDVRFLSTSPASARRTAASATASARRRGQDNAAPAPRQRQDAGAGQPARQGNGGGIPRHGCGAAGTVRPPRRCCAADGRGWQGAGVGRRGNRCAGRCVAAPAHLLVLAGWRVALHRYSPLPMPLADGQAAPRGFRGYRRGGRGNHAARFRVRAARGAQGRRRFPVRAGLR